MNKSIAHENLKTLALAFGFILLSAQSVLASNPHPGFMDAAIKRLPTSTFPQRGWNVSCSGCHAGPPTINNKYGGDFRGRAVALFGRGSNLTQTQINQLVDDPELSGRDSDLDGDSNQVEYQNGTDPSDALSNNRPMVTPTPGPAIGPGTGVGKRSQSSISASESNQNMLSGGCGSRATALDTTRPFETHKAGFSFFNLMLPLAIMVALRKKK